MTNDTFSLDMSRSNAKEVYQSIMSDIQRTEKSLSKGHTLCVNIMDMPGLEIITIGRIGDHLLFFEGYLNETNKIRVLTHYSRAVVVLIVQKDADVPAYRPKGQIQFAVEQ